MAVTPGAPALDHSYARAVPELSLPWESATAGVDSPSLLTLDEPLAAELGLDTAWLRSEAGIRWLLGRAGDGRQTYAHIYAGHQFGGYSPRLGDGRALLLGEATDTQGQRRDIHLKGSGRTPLSRGGDGLAAVGPMLREHVMGVWAHALGIPTTRALAVIGTGQQVLRQEGPLPGAVLVRVAASHLRVGTVQYAAATGDRDLLQRLVAHAIERHHPQAAAQERPALALLEAVVEAQASLIAQWMAAGLVHGVMNTDNMTLSGESIDYGPVAVLDAHDPAAVFSSIDSGGRYAYGNQPAAAQWNLARLAEALLPLIDDDPERAVALATEAVETFAPRYDEHLIALVSAKLGLPAPGAALAAEALQIMAAERVDHTGFFRALARGAAGDLVIDRARFDDWAARREAALQAAGRTVEQAAAAMDAVNPAITPRNLAVEQALAAASAGDLAPVHRLIEALRHPFEERPGEEDLATPAPGDAPRHVTFCGT